jgi:hypothetical protein
LTYARLGDKRGTKVTQNRMDENREQDEGKRAQNE